MVQNFTNTRNQDLPSNDDLTGDIFPEYLFFQNFTVFYVVYHYKNGLGKTSSFSQTFQFYFNSLNIMNPQNQNNTQDVPINTENLDAFASSEFNDEYDFLYLTRSAALGLPVTPNQTLTEDQLNTVNQTFLTRNYVVPLTLSNSIGLIRTKVFLGILEEYFFKYIRALQSSMVTYKKIDINILMPLGFPSIENVALDSYTLVDSFSIILNSGITGMLSSDYYIKIGALEFLLYPKDENLLQRKTASYNKPGRLLIRGCAEPLATLNDNVNLKNFTTNYPTPKLLEIEQLKTDPTRTESLTLSLVPKIRMLNDNFKIAFVQCGGYSRVAGQKDISPFKLEENSVLQEENLSNTSNGSSPSINTSNTNEGGVNE